jgi:hypothetical protein
MECTQPFCFSLLFVRAQGRSGELGQRMVHVDDLVQAGAEEVLLSAVPTLFRPHRESPNRASRRENHGPIAVSICRIIGVRADHSGEIEYFEPVRSPR